jgi:hypothetical protein
LVFIGVAETSATTGIDAMNPSSKEEFDEFQTAIAEKVQSYTKSPHFPAFVEDLIRNICVNCKYTNKLNYLKNNEVGNHSHLAHSHSREEICQSMFWASSVAST